ncbi:hypothetical protein I6B53_09555 [Schaalia sp. 19OD2882]|uniref:DUF418 domain-containing protein n=1 Tax=Schaalia sp. 19OD2882 TaxID=2794089 RepID=UPI001C1EB140|nr:hypothetical protein [Schaalia sp. 19OD2882]QWW19328.1 hypothetical protein I6B53_09555 [Schaalia sp. 19OD2882]
MTSGPLSSSQSFTGASGVRHPAPDVARGAMLILIAVANVPAWIAYFPEAAERTVLDQWWVVVRSALVDHRAYPLFALLFGYGLMTMVLRRSAAHERSRIAQLDARAPGLPLEQRAAWEEAIRKEARLDARRLVTRRGWWMLLFGACHALLFPGDIIGTYALVALVFGVLLAGRHFRWMTAIGIVATVVLTYLMVSFAHYGGQLGVDFSGAVGGTERLTWSWPLSNVGLWLSIQPLSILGTLIVPAAFIGAWLATTDIVSDPQRHRSLLWATAGVGLTLTALGGLPEGLVAAGMGESGTLWKFRCTNCRGFPAHWGGWRCSWFWPGPPCRS